MVVRDELPFLQHTLHETLQLCDELVVLDTGSTDGTVDFVKSRLRSTDKLITGKRNVIPWFGFAYVRNMAASQATCDWIHFLDADECVSWNNDSYSSYKDRSLFRQTSEEVIQIHTVTFNKQEDLKLSDGLSEIHNNAKAASHEVHRRIYRRDSGIMWQGYIHEELFKGNVNCYQLAKRSDVTHWHFKHYRDWGDPNIKWYRYGWMLNRAMHEPKLREWTNQYWYEDYYPKHIEEITEWCKKYEELRPDYEA